MTTVHSIKIAQPKGNSGSQNPAPGAMHLAVAGVVIDCAEVQRGLWSTTVGRASFLTASALMLITAHAAPAATFKSFQSNEGNIVAILSGEIINGDASQLTSIIRDANARTKFVSGIRLNSPGGDLAEGVKLADVIRDAKMATIVTNGSTCASACFVAFAAGAEKYASNSGKVGVHGASENGAETASSSAATIAMARIVKDLGVPAAVLGKMVVTPPSEVVWLTANDLRAMGTTMTGKPAQLASSSPSAATPHQLTTNAPNGPMQATAAPTWKSITDRAIAMSASQNGGTAQFNRLCQPELRSCSTAVFFKGNDGTSMMARTIEDMSGALTQREICSFNQFGDVRKCMDWDKNATHTDMKDSKGNWSEIAHN